MRIVFLGGTDFSEFILKELLRKGFLIKAIFGIPEIFSINYEGQKQEVRNHRFADLKPLARFYDIPHYVVDQGNSETTLKAYKKVIKDIYPDVILVMGWYYKVPESIRNLSKNGAWGIHASLLPKYAGGAPLVWAMIEGEEETGVTLFKLEEGIDDGPIIAQKKFPIYPSDTIKEVLDKSFCASINILLYALNSFESINFKEQKKDEIQVYPQRKPEDGEIDWSKSPQAIQNFIRAQTRPYPGAFTYINGKKVIIWDADVYNFNL